MIDRVLTDEELQDTYRTDGLCSLASRAGLRSVEQMVLKRMEPIIRERERAAWDVAATYFGGSSSPVHIRERDRRYPAIPPEPKVVTGPSGAKYRTKGGRLQAWNSSKGDWFFPVHIHPADAPTVADLMREGK